MNRKKQQKSAGFFLEEDQADLSFYTKHAVCLRELLGRLIELVCL